MNDDRLNEEQDEQVSPDDVPVDATGAARRDESTNGAETEIPDEELTLEERLAVAEARAEEYLDGWQRARAEFANARKRMERERAEAYRNAKIDVIARLLPVIDDYDRALDNVPDEIAADSWFEGVQLVRRKLHSLLDKENIEKIEAVGQPFDPNLHDAIMTEESEEFESGHVVRELQTGYRLDERVLRPSLVVVAA